MKLYFMKNDALEIVKSNLDLVYNMYFTENDNKWLWKICDGDPFVEFKEVPDFSLAKIDEDVSKGEIEFENCKLIYKNLSFLSESQACDERVWAGLCHSVFYEYLRKRWDYDKKRPKTQKEAISNIKSRFFLANFFSSLVIFFTIFSFGFAGEVESFFTSFESVFLSGNLLINFVETES